MTESLALNRSIHVSHSTIMRVLLSKNFLPKNTKMQFLQRLVLFNENPKQEGEARDTLYLDTVLQ